MLSNAHAKNTPFRVGQIAKARREIAAILTGAPDPDALAGRILDELQALGWTPPHDPTADQPPITGRGANPEHRARCMAEIRDALANGTHGE